MVKQKNNSCRTVFNKEEKSRRMSKVVFNRFKETNILTAMLGNNQQLDGKCVLTILKSGACCYYRNNRSLSYIMPKLFIKQPPLMCRCDGYAYQILVAIKISLENIKNVTCVLQKFSKNVHNIYCSIIYFILNNMFILVLVMFTQ